MRKYIIILAALFLLMGCASGGRFQAGRYKQAEPRFFRVDLDNDGLKEFIKVDESGPFWEVSLARPGKEAFATLKADGRLMRLEFIDLKQDGCRQMELFYYSDDGVSNLSIYSLKEEKLSELFSASSRCAIETDFSGVLRIKVSKPSYPDGPCPADNSGESSLWVWAVDKFVKER